MTGRSEGDMVADALEMDPVLLPVATDLLADIDALGADVELIVEVLAGLGLGASSTVIDLGAGKGAVSVAIARQLGCRVLGIELFAPFVDLAEAAAARAGVSSRCRFIHGDIAKLAGVVEAADAVVFAALGDVLGRLDETMGIIRRFAAPGGFVLVNDCFLREGAPMFPRFEGYAGLSETRRRLTAWGDDLVREVLEATDGQVRTGEEQHEEEDEAGLIAARATALADRRPDLAPALREFAQTQRDEYDFLATQTQGALWVVRRSAEFHG